MKFFKRQKSKSNQVEIPFVYSSVSSHADWIRKNPDSKQIGVLYLLKSDELNSYKIGITRQNSETDRIEEHLKRGWFLVQTWTLENVVMAEAVEQSVIEWWRRELKLKPSTTAENLPQGGFTETVSCDDLSLYELVEFIEKQCERKITRPSIAVEIADLNIGVRSIITGTVTEARITLQRAGQYRGKYIYSWIYRYLVSDGKNSVVVESHQKRKHAATPLVGYSINVEGRPYPTSSQEHKFGFINPAVKIDEAKMQVTTTHDDDCIKGLGHVYGAYEDTSDFPDIYAGWKCAKCGKETTEDIDLRVLCNCRKSTLKGHVFVSKRHSKKNRHYVIPDSVNVNRHAFCRKCGNRPMFKFYSLHQYESNQVGHAKSASKDINCSRCFLMVNRHSKKCPNEDDNCPIH